MPATLTPQSRIPAPILKELLFQRALGLSVCLRTFATRDSVPKQKDDASKLPPASRRHCSA